MNRLISPNIDLRMMPNRYLPRELVRLIHERQQDMNATAGGENEIPETSDEYTAEYEALVTMLQPQYREAFIERREENKT